MEGIQACKRTQQAITTPTWATPTGTTVSLVCAKCGTVKNSGKPSCCARGGAWFNKCGNPGDSNFDYMWTEGIEACKRTSQPITTRIWATPITTTVSPVCSKCGTVKNSGKRSCCARGGAWFNKCGSPGDSNFDHTWMQGIQACKGFVSLFSHK